MVAVFFFTGIQLANAQCNLKLSIQVYDEDTKEALPNSTIVIKELNWRVKTDSLGRSVFLDLCPGTYNLLISHEGCTPMDAHIHLKNNMSQRFNLPHAATELEQVTIVGQGNRKELSHSEMLKSKDLEAKRGLSLGEALGQISGVNVLQTGTNIFKPIIHGLHSNRVLVLNNGIRQEGQQWGSEHAPELDPYIATRLTVIKGAGSLRYGGDAIGGVVLVEPRLLSAVPGWQGEINLAAFSNNRMGVISGILEQGPRKPTGFAWRLQGTLKRGGNARTPDYWLANSGLAEYNISATGGWRGEHKGLELFYSQFNTKLGIFAGSHIGNTTDLLNAIEQGIPPENIRNQPFSYQIDRPYQLINHHLLKAKAYWRTGTYSRINLISSAQYNLRKEYDLKRFASSTDRPQLDMGLATVGSDLAWEHYSGNIWRGTIGLSGIFQANDYYERFFIPNYRALNAGLYIIEKMTLGNLQLEGGLRFDSRNFFQITRNSGEQFNNRNYHHLSGNGTIRYAFSEVFQVSLNGSSTWRPPHVNELFSNGLHHGAARIEVGQENLKLERADGLMANFELNTGVIKMELGIFHKEIRNFIFLKPDYPPQLTIRGSFPSFLFDQTNARLTGLDFKSSLNFGQHFIWHSRASLLRAYDKMAEDWLIQIPADKLEQELELVISDSKNWKESFLKIQIPYHFRQSRVPSKGNILIKKPDGSISLEADYAPAPEAYMLLGFEGGTSRVIGGKQVQFILTGTNLLNKAYRDYLNAFRYFSHNPGINIALKVKISFQTLRT